MKRWTKRFTDLFLATLGLVLLSPLLGVISLAIRLTMGSPIFFRQLRAGYKGHAFVPLKFRTMNYARDEQGRLLPDGDRLTVLGKFLRQYSLDELPQLWNVLIGDMSLVGPRPLLVEYLPRYTPEQSRRHEVKPGVTGWAQVNGRNTLTWDQKFGLDVWYVDHASLWLDLKILALTIWNTFARKAINQPGHATAEEFMGTSR